MTQLDQWLEQATCRLSRESTAQVRTEIQEHFLSAREAAMAKGATAEEAERLALTALGDASTANRQYRKVMLTSGEAKLLEQGNWQARAFHAHRWRKWQLAVAPIAALVFAAWQFDKGQIDVGRAAVVSALTMALVFSAPLLPVNTPSRGLLYRFLKWLVMFATIWVLFAPMSRQWWWLGFTCVWPVFWTEWNRISIRRKLPVAKWPKQLYL